MTPADKKSRRRGLVGAALFFSIGVFTLVRGHYADAHHTFIPGGSKAGWMSPWQAYAASIMSFLVTAYALVLAFRKRKDDPQL